VRLWVSHPIPIVPRGVHLIIMNNIAEEFKKYIDDSENDTAYADAEEVFNDHIITLHHGSEPEPFKAYLFNDGSVIVLFSDRLACIDSQLLLNNLVKDLTEDKKVILLNG